MDTPDLVFFHLANHCNNDGNCRVALERNTISKIEESSNDDCTLIYSHSGRVIAVTEDFDTVVDIWEGVNE